jgi:hypothetical protein
MEVTIVCSENQLELMGKLCEQNTYLLNGGSYHYHCVLRKIKDGKK